MGNGLDFIVRQVDLLQGYAGSLVHLDRFWSLDITHLTVDKVHDSELLNNVVTGERVHLGVVEREHLEFVSVLHLQDVLVPGARLGPRTF